MSKEKETNRGRLIPTRPTGIQYEVECKVGETVVPVRTHGRSAAIERGARWVKCFVRSVHANMIPDGNYYLYSEDGRIRQVKSTDGKWEYLAVAG